MVVLEWLRMWALCGVLGFMLFLCYAAYSEGADAFRKIEAVGICYALFVLIGPLSFPLSAAVIWEDIEKALRAEVRKCAQLSRE